MRAERPARVGYIVKRYPRFSETFIVNEILAHERAGLSVDIFSLYPPNDTHFQDQLSRVRAPVTYLSAEGLRGADLWQAMGQTSGVLPGIWTALPAAVDGDAREVYQAVVLARLAVERGLTHLHAHFATVSAQVARLASRISGIPYTVTAHAKDIYHEEVNSDRLRCVLRDAAAVVTVSDFNALHLVTECGVEAPCVHRIYNGLDFARFPYSSPAARAPEIVAVGRLVPKKGFTDLVDAVALLAARGMKFHCRIVGAGPEEGRLRARIAAAGLETVVSLVGPQPQQDVVRVVGAAAVFVAPCVVSEDGDRDGLPTVLLEAMALGTPCVSTDVVGIPEIVQHERTGLLVSERAPQELADSMARLLQQGRLRTKLAEGARRLVEREFDVDRNAAQLREVFMNSSMAGATGLALAS